MFEQVPSRLYFIFIASVIFISFFWFIFLLHPFLLINQRPLVDFVDVFSEWDVLFTSIRKLLLVSKDGGDLTVEILSSVSHEKKLESVFNRNLSVEVLVVHEELDQVKKLPWLQACLVGDASLIHHFILLFWDVTIEIIVNFPNDKLHFWFQRFAAQPGEDEIEIVRTDFVLVLFLLASSRKYYQNRRSRVKSQCRSIDRALHLFS